MFLITILTLASSISVTLTGKGYSKCFNQRVEIGSEVSMAYVVSGENEKSLAVALVDPTNRVVYQNPPKTREGKFEEKSKNLGLYRLCFQSKDNSFKSVSFAFHINDGMEEDKMATQVEINPLRSHFRFLSRNLDTVYRNLQFYERREKVHRDIAEVTCDRVLFCGFLKIFGLSVISVGQIWVLIRVINNIKRADSV